MTLSLIYATDGGPSDISARLATLQAGGGMPAFSMGSGGVPTDGTTDASAALNLLIASIPDYGPGSQFLVIKMPEVVYLAHDVTIPKHIRVLYYGGVFKVASGVTLTINQPVGDVAYRCFDESLGGHVVCGAPMEVRPEHWGARGDGVTDCAAARDAAFYALSIAAKGGTVQYGEGTWMVLNAMETVGQHFGAGFGNIRVRGKGPGTVWKFGFNYANAGGNWMGYFSFYGPPSPESAWGQRIEIMDGVFEGFDTTGGTDCNTPVIIDQWNDMLFENVRFRWFGIECVRGFSGTSVKNFTAIKCKAYKTGMIRGAGVFNVGAQQQQIIGCTNSFTSAALETGNSYTLYEGNTHTDSVWGWMIGSTWSGWIDALNGNVQYNARGALVQGNFFVRMSDRCGLIPDCRGHANPNYPATSPAHLDGYLGGVTVQGNYYETVSTAMWGGADLMGEIKYLDNTHRGAYGSVPAQSNCIAPTAGIWTVRGNSFRLGNSITWNALVGTQYVGWSPLSGDRFTFEDNEVIDKCWGASPMIVNGGWQHTFARTKFRNVDNAIAGTTVLYRHIDLANNVIQQMTGADFAFDEPDHKFSMLEAQRIPVRGDVMPPIMNWKIGDRLIQLGTASWNGKRVTAPGTTGHSALVATGAAASGSPVMTMTTTAGLSAYEFVSVPTGGVAVKQIKSVDSPTQVTMFTNFEATVAAGTVVSFATPAFASN